MTLFLRQLNETMEFTNTNLELEVEDFNDNEGVRQHIKLLLNSALGKFNQKNHNIKCKFVKSADELEDLFRQKYSEILSFNEMDSVCQVSLKDNFPLKKRQANPTILAFITANARIFLHKQIMQLVDSQFQPFYTDTDSILFSGPKHCAPPLNFGFAFGDFKHELGENSKILEFKCNGRKNFSLRYETETGKEFVDVKVAGMTLSSKISQEELEKLNGNENAVKITQVRHTCKAKFHKRVPIVQKHSMNTIVSEKCQRIVNENSDILSTYPFGYL